MYEEEFHPRDLSSILIGVEKPCLGSCVHLETDSVQRKKARSQKDEKYRNQNL